MTTLLGYFLAFVRVLVDWAVPLTAALFLLALAAGAWLGAEAAGHLFHFQP